MNLIVEPSAHCASPRTASDRARLAAARGTIDAGLLSSELHAAVEALPFRPMVRSHTIETFRLARRPGAVVAMPVRNEDERLPACLAALEIDLDTLGAANPVIVVVVNNSDDKSADVVRAWAERAAVPAVLCVVRLDPAVADAAHARRIAMDVGERIALRDGAILTTDADTVVAPGWAAALLSRIREGATLVGGAVDVHPAELAALPPCVHRAGVVERELLDLLDAIWARIVPGEPCPFTPTAMGANMGIGAAAYRAVGRLPLDEPNEDRALARAVLLAGGTIAVDAAARVTTSCRLDGRAANGLADALRERCLLADPPIDSRLMRVRLFVLASLAFRLLAPSRAAGSPSGAARSGDAPASAGGLSRFGVIDRVLSACRVRLTTGEGETEIARGRRLLALLDQLGPPSAATPARILALVDAAHG